MSDRKTFAEFRRVMADNGVPRPTVNRLLKLAERHQMLCLIGTNEPVKPKFDAEEAELEQELAKLAGGGITEVEVGGDPRGATVKLRLANGQGSSMGDSRFYCVPVRELTAAEAARVARLPPMRWTRKAR